VLAANQSVYAQLTPHFDVTLVTPRRWRDELRPIYDAEAPQSDAVTWVPLSVVGIGRPQRHLYRARVHHLLARWSPQFLIIEEEPFSLSARQWASAARRLEIRYAVQVAENRPRRLPPIVRRWCRTNATLASFVLARSPEALLRAREWGYRGPESIIAHGVDNVAVDIAPAPSGVLGFVGRLNAAKGVDDLVAVMAAHPQLRLRVAGDGPARNSLTELGSRVECLGTLKPEQMADFYDSVTVVAVPSRTTPTWSEQFGRVIVESQARGRPVVAYASGEIPWVASLTAAETVAEGDVVALGNRLAALASNADEVRQLGTNGRDSVRTHFDNRTVAATFTECLRRAITTT
jgi:glycosyltransferase involved in cell wall biosynthesis